MGVSKDYIAQLPYDFLSGPRLADIRSAAEDRYNIENLEAQLLDRTQMHQYASTAFKNYTRSRDQYLGKVDGMMADLNDYMLTADTSDPRTAARMNAYRNYLSGTRNRVQKRYIDIINESLDQENLDYERFNNLYTMHMKRAEQLIADTNASATNAYNTVVPLITQSITEAYNFVEQMRDSANGMTSLEFELSAAAEDLKAKGLSNTLTQANIDQTEAETQNIKDGKNADGSTPGGKTDKVSASAVEDSAYFNDGDSWIYADPDTLVQFAKDKNYDVGELSRAYVGAASKDIKARAAEGSLELANQFLGGAAALADTEYDEAYSAYFELTTAAYVGGLSEFFASVRTSLNKIIEKQLDGKYDSQEEFKSALKNSLPSVDDAFADALYAALNDEYSDEERKKILTDNSVLATRILWVYGNSLGLLEEASA
jgi:hypothetical protein